jgi:hypothetical protein
MTTRPKDCAWNQAKAREVAVVGVVIHANCNVGEKNALRRSRFPGDGYAVAYAKLPAFPRYRAIKGDPNSCALGHRQWRSREG